MNQLVSNVSFWAGVILSWAAVKAFLSVCAVFWIQAIGSAANDNLEGS